MDSGRRRHYTEGISVGRLALSESHEFAGLCHEGDVPGGHQELYR